MLKSLTVSFLFGFAALFGWSTSPLAQTTPEVAPVPGPYSAAPVAKIAIVTPAPRAVTASRAASRTMRQMMPYWMRPSRSPQAGQSPQSGQRQQQFIPGWVWSRSTASAPTAAQRQYRPTQRPISAYGYQNGPRNRYFGPGPMWQQMPPWQQYQGQNNPPNYRNGAPPQYGGQQQNRQQYRPQYQTPSN